MSILSTVQATVKAALGDRPNQVKAAKQCGVHRNFLIDLLNGRLPKVRDGNKFADEDPRYAKVATGLGLDPTEFIAMAAREQRMRIHSPKGEGEHDVETGVGRTHYGGLIINLSRQTLAMPNILLSFDIPEGRVTVTIQPHVKT